jgi:hypothetical protein
MQITAADGALHVRLECAEASVSDAIDIILDPGGDGLRQWRYTLLPNGACTEQVADEGGELAPAACVDEVRYLSSLRGTQWHMEIALPFARIGARPEWTWRVTRTQLDGDRRRRSTWAPLNPTVLLPSHEPVSRLRTGSRTLDWHLSQARVAVSGNEAGIQTFWPSVRVTSFADGTLGMSLGAGREQVNKVNAVVDVTLPAGVSRDVALPSFASPSMPVNDRVLVTARESGAQGDVSHIDARLATTRHVHLRVLEPAYRGNIYNSQDVERLVLEIRLSTATASVSTSVNVQLVDELGVVARAVRSAASAELTRTFEIGSLPEGNYTLVASALRENGDTVAQDRVPVRKLGMPRGSEVRIDDRGNILVNGHPQLLIGWYGALPRDDPRPEVLALQNVQTAVILAKADPQPIRDAFSHGVYSIVSVDPLRLWGSPSAGPARTAVADEMATTGHPSAATLDLLRSLVRAVRDEPGLLGYYLADEPEISSRRSDYLEQAYAELAELDPYHPVVITNMTTDGLATHGARAADILNPDPYSAHADEVPRFMRAARNCGQSRQALMATLWQASFRRHYENLDAGPYPFRVTRAQYLSAVALGAHGFTGYVAPFFMPEPTLRYGLPPIWRELRFLEPAVAAPPPDHPLFIDGSSEVYGWIRSVGSDVYAITSNPSDRATTVTIHHPLLRDLHEIAVVAEDRTVAIAQGALQDTLPGGGVHVYSTNRAGRMLPTIAQTEADIAAEQQLSQAPGNVLHDSQGTWVYSVRGFQPAFSRYFEYVTNGVRDDEGWHVPSVGVDPPWFQVVLPAPKPVGHVVVYTPNLRDFDLELVDARGGRHVAAIRGNAASEVHVPVHPSLTMVKLRLTALACRPGSVQGPMVREIEAFAAGPPASPIPWLASPPPAPVMMPAGPHAEPVWTERFEDPSRSALPGPAHDAWSFDPKMITVVPGAHGGVAVWSTAPIGYAAMSRRFHTDLRGRYLQARIESVEGEGYPFYSVGVRSGAASSTPLVADRAGFYTIDLHALSPPFTDASTRELLVSLHLAGSRVTPGGEVLAGPRVTFDWLRLTGNPMDALVVSLPDGSPVPEHLTQGDQLLVRLQLTHPANDAVVEWHANPGFLSLTLNGEPYLQMARAGTGDGREWVAHVTLGPKCDRFDGTKAFPLVARAVLSGGSLRDTSTMIAARFD